MGGELELGGGSDPAPDAHVHRRLTYWTWSPHRGWGDTGLMLEWNRHGGVHRTQGEAVAAAKRVMGEDAVVDVITEPGYLPLQREHGEQPERNERVALERLRAWAGLEPEQQVIFRG